MQWARTFALVVAVVVGFGEIAHAGPIRPLYLSTGTEIHVIQGGSVIDSWLTGDQEYSIAVNTTLKTWSQGNPSLSLLGREYLLDGTPTGVSYANTVGCCFRDGTTDGQFNYAIRQLPAGNVVYRFNLDWTDPQVTPIVTTPALPGGITGIAYDSSDDTFWLASSFGGNVTVLHVTRTGGLISFFNANGGSLVSLAYDRADDTLWLYSAQPLASELRQYSTSDAPNANPFPLSAQPGIGFVAAIEFQLQQSSAAVPEPATAGLLAFGLAMLSSVRARRRKLLAGTA
jgi:hypothetical protein